MVQEDSRHCRRHLDLPVDAVRAKRRHGFDGDSLKRGCWGMCPAGGGMGMEGQRRPADKPWSPAGGSKPEKVWSARPLEK